MSLPTFPSRSEAQHEEGFLHAKDNLRLYWQRYTPPTPRATVAIFPGGGDHSGRYPGITAALVRAGFQVALVDFRGHGQSDGRRWHVDSFDDYLGDVDTFLGHVRKGAGERKVFVVGHSMGALIATTWAFTAPAGAVAGFVLSSPYFRLKFQPPRLKILAAQLIGKVVPWVPLSTGLRYEELTTDEELQRWTEADPLYGKATTPRWLNESMRVQGDLMKRAPSFTAPLLVLAAGGDAIADPVAERAFVEAAGSSDKTFELFEGFKHEIFNERERDRPIAAAVAWLTARS